MNSANHIVMGSWWFLKNMIFDSPPSINVKQRKIEGSGWAQNQTVFTSLVHLENVVPDLYEHVSNELDNHYFGTTRPFYVVCRSMLLSEERSGLLRNINIYHHLDVYQI